MDLSPLTALSPLDGRYAQKVSELRSVFSEYGLIYQRVVVEIRWLQALAENPAISGITPFSQPAQKFLNSIVDNFSVQDAQQIKSIEATINHDVKSVEYFLKEKMKQHPELKKAVEFIHFACTSEDINNLSYALMIKTARDNCLLPAIKKINQILTQFAHDYASVAMLSRTHGQAATPTTVGKEFANFAMRVRKQMQQLETVVLSGKMNGAVGNFNAHCVAYPQLDWLQVSREFVESLGLTANLYTTQIEPHDYIAEFAHTIMRLNTILVDCCRDIWGYISLGYFTQKPREAEVGSSTMPHKINPIDFENAEGNLILANAVFQCLATQLPTSRWQRDLVDSTLLRNVGVALGHTLIAYQGFLLGVSKLSVDQAILKKDLDAHWVVLAEPIQTVMRCYGLEAPYEQLKTLTRGKIIDAKILQTFIDNLALPNEVKTTLKALTPENYIGIAGSLAKKI